MSENHEGTNMDVLLKLGQVGLVAISIIALIIRSCYTVYWEEKYKNKNEFKI